MKKTLILMLLVSCFMFNNCYANTIEIKESDIVFVNNDKKQENINSEQEILDEYENISVIRQNNKIGIFDKNTNSFIIEPIIDSLTYWNDTEWKINVSNLVGYINIANKTNFLTNNDELFLLDKYIKIKKDGKYGLIDKHANVILKPIYQKVGIVKTDSEEYISGKLEGKYKLFYNTGKLIPEEDLYKFGDDNDYALAKDLRPEFKKYKVNNAVVYQKLVQEPEAAEKYVYEVQGIEIPANVKVASIEKHIANNEIKPIENSNINRELLNVEKNTLILVKNEDKYGLKNKNEKEILPAEFQNLNIIKPCEHYSKPIILAQRNNVHSVYDLKGKLLAEEVYDKFNIYKYGKLYTYKKEDGKFILKCNGKEIGYLVIEDDGYKFTKTRFSLINPHKINELLISLLTIAQN